jgi:hypothetical protein
LAAGGDYRWLEHAEACSAHGMLRGPAYKGHLWGNNASTRAWRTEGRQGGGGDGGSGGVGATATATHLS